MFNVCGSCGAYHADKRVVDVPGVTDWADAICPVCGHAQRFRQLPLLIVAGASGTGKTVICRHLAGRMQDAILLEADILWRAEFDTPQDAYRGFGETWLRMVKNIAQAGRPVVLFGAGLGVPENLETCIERRYVGAIHRLALTCPHDELIERLRARPAWRGCDDAFIEEQLAFNEWFQTYGPTCTPPIALLDTASEPVEVTVTAVRSWIQTKLRADAATAAPR